MDTVVVAHMTTARPCTWTASPTRRTAWCCVNRIKPHTSFRGPIESGICKMIIIGMGKINGASAFHGGYEMTDFGKVLPPAAQAVVDNSRFLFGLGLVEDAFDDTAHVEAILGDNLIARETEASDARQVADGAHLYRGHRCAECHRRDRQGDFRRRRRPRT